MFTRNLIHLSLCTTTIFTIKKQKKGGGGKKEKKKKTYNNLFFSSRVTIPKSFSIHTQKSLKQKKIKMIK